MCIAQPEHLPWLGYFDKMHRADVFVFLDNVQFKKRYFENRNRIRTANGWTWMTVPVRSKGRFDQVLRDVEIDDERTWQSDHWKTLQLNYSRAIYFDQYSDFLENTYMGRKWLRLVDLNIELIRWGAEQLDIRPDFVRASELHVQGKATSLLLAICKELKAGAYLSGISGKEYLDERLFEENGISVQYQEFHHPIYPQLYHPFEPRMGFIDLLLNSGPESRNILVGNQSDRIQTIFT